MSDGDLLGLSEGEALAVVTLVQGVTAALAGVQALAMEGYTRRMEQGRAARVAEYADDPGLMARWEDTLPLGVESAADVFAVVQHQSPRGGRGRLECLRVLVTELPATFALVRAGRVELSRAMVVATEAMLMAPALRPVLDRELVHPGTARVRIPVVDLPTPQLRRRVARAVVRIDPGTVVEQAQVEERQRFVDVRPGTSPGLTSWSASQRSEVSVRAWAAIDALATTYLTAERTSGVARKDRRTVGQARADAMTDLILGNATITTTIDLLVPVPAGQVATSQLPTSRLPISQDCPGTPAAGVEPRDFNDAMCVVGKQHPRVGIILNEAVTAVLADPDVRVRLHAVDPVTGVQLGHDPTTYRPGKALADAVRARDQHCLFPGCGIAPKTADLDHVVPFPHGPTSLTNLVALCRRHHQFKHHAGWRLTMTPDGVCTWHRPHGRPVITRPASAHDTAA